MLPVDSVEHGRDILRLPAGVRPDPDFGQEYRLPGEGADRRDRGAEDAVIGVGRHFEIAVDANPCYVGRTGPVGAQRRHSWLLPIRSPEPRDVVRSVRTEHVYDVTPCGNPGRGRNVGVSPRVPVAVHLMSESDQDRMPPDSYLGCVALQIGVVLARRNCRQADVCGIDLNERHCAMSVGSLGELYIEFLIPTAVVQYYVRHASSFSGELAHSAISAKSALFVDAKILILRGGNNR